MVAATAPSHLQTALLQAEPRADSLAHPLGAPIWAADQPVEPSARKTDARFDIPILAAFYRESA
jgi:hypothetical protein